MTKGYTLIELLLVIAISAILFAIGFATYRDYSNQQSLLAVLRTVQTDLRLAQDSANAGNKPTGCAGVLNGYRFRVFTLTTYNVEAFCSNAAGNNFTSIKNPSPVTLPAGFTINWTASGGGNSVVFKTLSQGTSIPSGSSVTFTIRQTSTAKTKTVTIGSNGSIQ